MQLPKAGAEDRHDSLQILGVFRCWPQPSGAALCVRRLCIGGSLIGSIKETQEMLDLCGEKNITCEVEVRLLLLWTALCEARARSGILCAECSSHELVVAINAH